MFPVKGKAVRDVFFTQCNDDPNYWICRCGTKRKQAGTGWTNLVTHVIKDHAEEYAALRHSDESYQGSTSGNLSLHIYSKKASNIFGWLKFISSCNQPFYVSEKEEFVSHIKYEKINVDTLKNTGISFSSCWKQK